MSRRTSRLSTLLRVRRIQEEIKRARLADEVAHERRAKQVLEQAHEHYAAPADPLVAVETVHAFMAHRRHRVALAGSVRSAGAGVDAAANVTVLARHGWSEAAMRMAALERLEDRSREAARTELLATEQRTSEESSSAQRQRGPGASTEGKRP